MADLIQSSSADFPSSTPHDAYAVIDFVTAAHGQLDESFAVMVIALLRKTPTHRRAAMRANVGRADVITLVSVRATNAHCCVLEVYLAVVDPCDQESGIDLA